ncbi:MAG: substrate-binding domain-containing protein [Defluviitaleaceae bacterium]|nr:substrate-binding domain-containing protein [Defluviitaleaceae bacterium]
MTGKLFGSIIITALTAVGGLFGWIMAAIFTGEAFYLWAAPVYVVLLWLTIILKIWGIFAVKIRKILLISVLAAILLSIVGFEIIKAYGRSIELNDQGVDLRLYEPFKADTKAVSLSEPSTLRLTDNLLKLDGATALYPVYAAFARAVYPEGTYPAYTYLYPSRDDAYVVSSNTAVAYNRLISGEADMIFAAGPSADQLQIARDRGVEMVFTPIGKEAFVFFVNSRNPVNNLTIADIQKIYSGEAVNWREFGGDNRAIRAFQRPENSGSQTALTGLMGGIPLTPPPGRDVIDGMGGIISSVSAYRNHSNSIGYSFLFFATEMVNDNKIKLLSLEGVQPTRENVANGTYPYASNFYAVTAGTDNPNAGAFLDWILSEQGQYLILRTGYTPLTASFKGEG